MNWFALIPFLLVLGAAMWIPGLLIAHWLRVEHFTAWAVAPAVSGFLISVLALVAGVVGVDYGPGLLVGLILVLAAVSVGAWLVRRARGRGSVDGARGEGAAIVGAIAVGAVLMGLMIKETLRSPLALGQNFDNIFHQNAVRWILEHRNASPLVLGNVSGDGGGFYPALWHELAALPLMVLDRQETTAATSALILIAAGVVWVSGCVYLAHTLLPTRWVVLVSAGILAVSFPAFPLIPLGWGPLYPNFLGQALLPGLVGLAARVLGLGLPRPVGLDGTGRRAGAVLIVLATAGVALCHPNVLVSGLLIAVPMVGAWALRGLRPGQWWGRFRLVVFAGYLVGFLAAWGILRPPEWAVGYWQARHDLPTALGQVALQNPLTGLPAWPLAILVALGVYATLFRHRWLLISHLLVSGLFVVVSAFPSGPLRTALTGVWYNDSPRLAALIPVTSVPLAVLGVDLLARWSRAALNRLGRRGRWGRRARMAGGLVWLVLLILVTQGSAYLHESLDRVGLSYRLTDTSVLLTRDEMTVLRAVPEFVAPGDVIAVHPWAGGPLVYAVANREPTTRHGFHPDTPELSEIHGHLREAATRPEVCQAARTLHVRYALDFGMREVNGEQHPGYEGFRDLTGSPGFTELFRAGTATLLRLDACG